MSSQGYEEEPVPCLLLGSGDLLAVFGFPCLVKHHPDVCLHLHVVFSLGVCLCPASSSNEDTDILNEGPTLLQYYLILTNCICKDPIPQ